MAVAALVAAAPGCERAEGSERHLVTPADTALRAAVPFRFDTGNIFVRVLINGTGPHDFLLDTGSPVTALDRGLVARLGLEATEMGYASGAGGDSVRAERVEGVAVRVGTEDAAPDGAAVLPLDSLMSPNADRTVDGIVGFPFFRERVVELDFPADTLRVYEPAGYTYDGPGRRITMTVRDGWALVDGVADLPGIGPTPVNLMVDLGSRGNVLFTTPFVRRHRLDGFLEDTARATLGMGIGGAARFLLARIDGLQLGSMWVPDVVAGFSTGRALPFAQFGGVLGTGLLSRYRVILDYPGEEMILEEPGGDPASPRRP